uniref:Uncharacterized protein n=1 Tax=Tetranychus urticae TaxID=32264 RepID=T1KC59_TETUR
MEIPLTMSHFHSGNILNGDLIILPTPLISR